MITLRQAQNLVHLLEAGEQEQAEQLFLQFTAPTKQDLLRQVGQVERQLNDFFENVILDQQPTTLGSAKLPDLEERLDYVLDKTQRAVDKTLDGIEIAQPIVDELQGALSQLRTHWRSFSQAGAPLNDAQAVSVDAIFDKMDSQCQMLRKQLHEILIAQEFQDITGQVIAQVIGALQQIQTQFVCIMDLHDTNSKPKAKSAADLIAAEGPIVTTSQKQEKTVLKDQSEVDDLLSSLGL
ncbi:MAG: protein phosphatase CheZ [Vibrionaceae bacterium]